MDKKNVIFLLIIGLAFSTLLLASGCGDKTNRQGKEPWIPVDVPNGILSSEVLREYNKAFSPIITDEDGVTHATEISCFFTSFYDKASDIDLEDFLKYCPIGIPVTEEDEFREIKAIAGFDLGADKLSLMPTPIWKYDIEEIDNLLNKYTGITTEELSLDTDALQGLIYLESRNAYYNLTSDFGPGSFIAVSGEKQGDLIILTDSRGISLTIEMKNGYPLIVSFM